MRSPMESELVEMWAVIIGVLTFIVHICFA